MEVQAADTHTKVDNLTTRIVLIEEHIADLENRKIIIQKQSANTHQVLRKTFAAAAADGLPPKPIFQEAVNRNAARSGKQ
jgi:hypothetical protein